MLQGSGGGNFALHGSRRTLQLRTPTPFFTLKVIKYVSASVTCKIVAANQLWEILHGKILKLSHILLLHFNLQYNDPTSGALNIHLQYFTVSVCVCVVHLTSNRFETSSEVAAVCVYFQWNFQGWGLTWPRKKRYKDKIRQNPRSCSDTASSLLMKSPSPVQMAAVAGARPRSSFLSVTLTLFTFSLMSTLCQPSHSPSSVLMCQGWPLRAV